MLRTRRILVVWLALLVGLVAVGIGPAGTATAASKPKITKIGSGAGPLAVKTVVITGSNLTGATAVTFGSKKGSIVRVVSATSVEVKTPRGAKAGTVSVRIKTPAGWSATSSKARYTFVAKPSLKKLSVTKGLYTGGQKIKLTGKNLKRTSKVLFGTAAATIVSRASTSVVVRTPVGVLGATKVKVVSPGGTSGSKTFTYSAPPRENKSVVDAADETYVATTIDWVTGGYDSDSDTTLPWVVGLPKTARVPEVGKPFLIKPGNENFASGLAGSVDSVAVQADDSLRVTVVPTDLTTALDRFSVDYSGRLTNLSPGEGKRASSTKFPISRSALDCENNFGDPAEFSLEGLEISIADVDVSHHLDLGGFIHRPSLDVTVTAEVTTTGKIHLESGASCELDPLWANAHRKVVPLGTSGATISFGPVFEFGASAKGTFKVFDRTRTTWAVDAELGKATKFNKTSRSLEHRIGGAFSFGASMGGGLEMRLGILDRAGVSGKIVVELSANSRRLTGTSASPQRWRSSCLWRCSWI